MPKLVDPVERRRAVVDALFRVVVRDGLQRASLRTVAAEARLNIGSLRHYFATQQELMRFAMASMIERVAGRLQAAVEETGDPAALSPAERLELAARLLGELLPLDAPRRAEVTVFLDFAAASRTDPALRDLAGRAAVGTREFVGLVLARLGSGGVLRPGLRLDVETERLSSLVDGLGVNAVLRPELVSGDDCLEVVRAHLGSLAA
ncbi:TetR/AcrR family transcriptional regulator [Nonomuraea spiralis]|uniref:TetR/AcrR family transcriptional regulator n=1 Tax=Nonomuraea spiralis TaxID=46182 RepID=A0ABV5IGQ8_9ACTN|nr:TetR family transcriptional regulator C-terminal domain-containing protein [Nonomuraea spiralis]GGS71543.1 TetR family transcriptional regulator [Nonomuraea spiralis]